MPIRIEDSPSEESKHLKCRIDPIGPNAYHCLVHDVNFMAEPVEFMQFTNSAVTGSKIGTADSIRPLKEQSFLEVVKIVNFIFAEFSRKDGTPVELTLRNELLDAVKASNKQSVVQELSHILHNKESRTESRNIRIGYIKDRIKHYQDEAK